MTPSKRAADMTVIELAAYIDHSVLKPEFTREEIRMHIQEGIDFRCKTVCVNPAAVPIARELCADQATGISVVCDFPFGLSSTDSKVCQAALICGDGGIEDLDLVANYGWIRSCMWDEVGREIAAVKKVCERCGTLLKVILETDALTMDLIAMATDVACRANADFVKTSTGFYSGGPAQGAAPEVIAVMQQAAVGRCRIKGSGNIRTQQHFFQLIDMGIDRMGIGYRSTPVVLDQRQQ